MIRRSVQFFKKMQAYCRLIKAGYPVHLNIPPLYWAVNQGDIKTCRLLIEGGAAVDPQDDGHYAPLIRAVEKGNSELCRLLISAGAKLDAKDELSDTALMRTVSMENIEICQILLSSGANPNIRRYSSTLGDTALLFACEAMITNPTFTKFKIIQSLVECGADLNLKYSCYRGLAAYTVDGVTLLMMLLPKMKDQVAIFKNRMEEYESHLYVLFDFLVSKTPDLNLKDDTWGKTPLMHAITHYNILLCRLLIKYGADLFYIRDNEGRTAIDYLVGDSPIHYPYEIHYRGYPKEERLLEKLKPDLEQALGRRCKKFEPVVEKVLFSQKSENAILKKCITSYLVPEEIAKCSQLKPR